MNFEFDYADVERPAEIKCPSGVGQILLKMLASPIKVRNGTRVYLCNVTPLTIGFTTRVGKYTGIFRVITRENLKDPEHIRVFDLITTNAQHGGEAAEMALEFLNNTLT